MISFYMYLSRNIQFQGCETKFVAYEKSRWKVKMSCILLGKESTGIGKLPKYIKHKSSEWMHCVVSKTFIGNIKVIMKQCAKPIMLQIV